MTKDPDFVGALIDDPEAVVLEPRERAIVDYALKLTDDPIMLKALHFELGKIWEEKLPDTAKAIAGYKRVLELDSNDLGALTRLSALLHRVEDW